MLLIIKNSNKDINIPSKKKDIDRHGSIYYCPKSIKGGINWFPFMNIMDYTVHKIYNEITMLLSLLKQISMFQMLFCYDDEYDDQNNVENVAIRCSNC